jgi:uncharacterized membrane protein
MKRRLVRFFNLIRARPRLLIATAVGVAVAMFVPDELSRHGVTRALIGWNTGTLLYVALAAAMMSGSNERQMRYRAQQQDDGRFVIMALVCLAAIASLAAIARELAVVKEMHGIIKTWHIALAGTTVVSSWAFIQVMFALHYAHGYYLDLSRHRTPGLRFPDEEQPTYGDFFYFAAIIGTSGQTADVAFASKSARRMGSVHCILAYMFNTIVLALVINIGASLF